MANITLSLGAVTRTYTVSSGDAARMLAWATGAYPTDANGNALTQNQSLAAVLDATFAGWVSNTKNLENVNYQAAAPKAADIPFTVA